MRLLNNNTFILFLVWKYFLEIIECWQIFWFLQWHTNWFYFVFCFFSVKVLIHSFLLTYVWNVWLRWFLSFINFNRRYKTMNLRILFVYIHLLFFSLFCLNILFFINLILFAYLLHLYLLLLFFFFFASFFYLLIV